MQPPLYVTVQDDIFKSSLDRVTPHQHQYDGRSFCSVNCQLIKHILRGSFGRSGFVGTVSFDPESPSSYARRASVNAGAPPALVLSDSAPLRLKKVEAEALFAAGTDVRER